MKRHFLKFSNALSNFKPHLRHVNSFDTQQQIQFDATPL